MKRGDPNKRAGGGPPSRSHRRPRGRLVLAGATLATNAWFMSELSAAGFRVTAEPSIDLIAAYDRDRADLVLLDVGSPGARTLEAVRRMSSEIRVRLVVVTWRHRWSTIEAMLRLGVADFVRMPSSSEELVIRVQAAIDRARASDAGGATETEAGNGPRLRDLLPRQEWLLYSALAARAGQPITRPEMRRVVWGEEGRAELDSNIVDVYVCYLRSKLTALAPGETIETVRGVGYVLRRPF